MSANEFEEIVVLGSNYWVYNFTTKILPDHHLIKDMIDIRDGRWQSISEKEYTDFYEKCRREFKKRH